MEKKYFFFKGVYLAHRIKTEKWIDRKQQFQVSGKIALQQNVSFLELISLQCVRQNSFKQKSERRLWCNGKQ